ncbi:conserved hypothetical protein [Culex quinquefasciatus]|uniref:C2H2-type domain-containing protein n=1 Tax=Culex quinquefasciatus TaxID=7176 RepID=B0XFC7_CULQU|nr:conserved hypothetical protein [Culex quinquefasciatus]|eukprot:XP_001868349.1 conserved hypothetical protein [Culex quinquefasciatus]
MIQTYFVCDICLQSYNARDKLEEHKTHHENPKPLQCGVCLTAYVSQEEFNSHLCITYKDDYVCCERDFKYHFYYNKHMFLVHGLKTNVRVKPTQGLLLGQVRAMRKQAERCPRCEREFPTRNQKKQHMIACRVDGGGDGQDFMVGYVLLLQVIHVTKKNHVLVIADGCQLDLLVPCWIRHYWQRHFFLVYAVLL